MLETQADIEEVAAFLSRPPPLHADVEIETRQWEPGRVSSISFAELVFFRDIARGRTLYLQFMLGIEQGETRSHALWWGSEVDLS